MGRLNGKIAVVTGGAKGLGVFYVNALAQEGATVVLADIVEPTVETRSEFPPDRVVEHLLDVSDEAAVQRFVESVERSNGPIDILVNNAALFSSLDATDVDQIDTGLFNAVMAVNIRGPFLMVKHVAPSMKARRRGKIINISSGVAYKGMSRMVHYATSKGAMLSFTRSLARELGAYDICVNTLAPGLIMSDSVVANSQHIDDFREPVLASRSIKRDGYPQDLVGALVFLASSESDFITGQTIAIDGGSVNT